MPRENIQANFDKELAEDIGRFYDDPYGFVMYSFPWGEEGTALSTHEGPREWQRQYLKDLGKQVKKNAFNGTDPVDPVQFATASGHSIGKSALVSWIILWIMSTRPFAKGVVTANTSDQLRTKTWSELRKWHVMCITGHWFDYNGSTHNLNLVHKEHPEQWRCDGQTCREENSEAFAGLHAHNSSPFMIFDEASAIPDKIYETASGGMTDGEPFWLLFGNPTRKSGRFFECFNAQKHRWVTRQIDSRQVEGTNKRLFQQWVDDYGENSDYVRVRVRGKFPSASDMQFIASDDIEKAMAQEPGRFAMDDPIIMGVDVARGGEDENVIFTRVGMDAAYHPMIRIPGEKTRDTTYMIAAVTQQAEKVRPDMIFVDATGIGGPIADRLRNLGFRAIDVHFGSNCADKQCANMAAYMWWKMREAIQSGGLILPKDNDLERQLAGREYTHDSKDRLVMEKKRDMKKRGLSSPDLADALALTFAQTIAKRRQHGYNGSEPGVQTMDNDYDPYEDI